MMLGLYPGERALVIAACPGDESFGMGGTIAVMAVHGVAVDVVAMAIAASVMPGGSSRAQARLAEFSGACDVLGVHDRKIEWIDSGPARNMAGHPARPDRIDRARTRAVIGCLPAGCGIRSHSRSPPWPPGGLPGCSDGGLPRPGPESGIASPGSRV